MTNVTRNSRPALFLPDSLHPMNHSWNVVTESPPSPGVAGAHWPPVWAWHWETDSLLGSDWFFLSKPLPRPICAPDVSLTLQLCPCSSQQGPLAFFAAPLNAGTSCSCSSSACPPDAICLHPPGDFLFHGIFSKPLWSSLVSPGLGPVYSCRVPDPHR